MNRFVRWVLRSPWLVLVVTSVIAVVAAIVEQVIEARVGDGWSWPKFWEAVSHNVFFAVVVTILTTVIEARQRTLSQSRYVIGHGSLIELAVTGWSADPDVDETRLSRQRLTDLAAYSSDSSLAAKLEALCGADEDDDLDDS